MEQGVTCLGVDVVLVEVQFLELGMVNDSAQDETGSLEADAVEL